MKPELLNTCTLKTVSQSPRDGAFVQDPYEFYARAHEAHAVFFWDEYGMVALAGCDAVNQLFRDRRFGRQILHVASRDELGWPERPAHLTDFDRVEKYSLLELEPPAHTKLRRLITKAFVSRQVETLRPAIRETCHAQIDAIERTGSAELLKTYAMQVPLVTIYNLLGVSISHGQSLLDWSHAIVRMYTLDPTQDEQVTANAAARDFAAFLEEEIDRKRAQPGDDLLSALIAVESEGDTLTIDELISTSVVLLNAGHEATVHQFGNAIRTLLVEKYDIKTLFASDEATQATVEELIRYDAPLHMFTRYALEDLTLEVEGQSIPFKKGEQIALLLAAANRDPRAFANPHRFDPARADQKNVSFGAGIHFCIGAPLARIELQEMLSVLFERLPDIQLADTPHYADVYHFHGLEALNVKW
ncbi:MAG: cytochrome P450 [Pseudomonadota bacterium]